MLNKMKTNEDDNYIFPENNWDIKIVDEIGIPTITKSKYQDSSYLESFLNKILNE
jgi:hypothetical protein